MQEFLEMEGLCIEAMQPGRGSFVDEFIKRQTSTLLCGYDDGEHLRPSDDQLQSMGLGPGIDTSVLEAEEEPDEEGGADSRHADGGTDGARDAYVDFIADPRVQPHKVGSLHLAILGRASVCCVVSMAVYYVRQVCQSYDMLLSGARKATRGVRELKMTCFPRVACVGTGPVGSAISAALLYEDKRYACTSLRQKLRDEPSLVVCTRNVHAKEELSKLPSFGVEMTESIKGAVAGADVVILALSLRAYEAGVHKEVLAGPLGKHTTVLLCCSLPEVAEQVRKDLDIGKRLVHLHAALLDWHGWDGLERWATLSGNLFGPGPVDALTNRKLAEQVGEYVFQRVDHVATCTSALIENVLRKRKGMRREHANLLRMFDRPAFDIAMRGVMGHCNDNREVAAVLMPAAYDRNLLEPHSVEQSNIYQHKLIDAPLKRGDVASKRIQKIDVNFRRSTTMDRLMEESRDEVVDRVTAVLQEEKEARHRAELDRQWEESKKRGCITVGQASDNVEIYSIYPENLAHIAWRRSLHFNNVQDGMFGVAALERLRDAYYLGKVRDEIDSILATEDAIPLDERADPMKEFSLRAVACAVARDTTKFSPLKAHFLRRPLFATDLDVSHHQIRDFDLHLDRIEAGEVEDKGINRDMFAQARKLSPYDYGAAGVMACRFRFAQTLCQVTRGGRPVPWLPRNEYDAAGTSKNPFG